MKAQTNRLVSFALLTLGLAGLLGCQSSKPGDISHAAIQVRGHSLEDIQQTTTAVFRDEGYALTAATSELMVFDRPGSRRDAIKWGGILGAGVTMRVKVRLSVMLDGDRLLRDKIDQVKIEEQQKGQHMPVLQIPDFSNA